MKHALAIPIRLPVNSTELHPDFIENLQTPSILQLVIHPPAMLAHERPGPDKCAGAGGEPENRMSTAETTVPTPGAICAQLHEQTLQACRVARIAAGIVAEGMATDVPSLLDGVREREKGLAYYG